MRFELSVALKYLIPRWRQLSVSIISLVSICVISLVVWLVVVFLSVTEGLEKKWIEELVAVSAPVRMRPTEAYYDSYYYKVDAHSLASNYTAKSIGEKLSAPVADPYNPSIDAQMPPHFPLPETTQIGSVRDLVKEGYDVVHSLSRDFALRPQEYEVSFGNVRLTLLRDHPTLLTKGTHSESSLSQVSYIASYDPNNRRLDKLLIPPSAADINNLLTSFSIHQQNSPLSLKQTLEPIFANADIHTLQTGSEGWVLPPAFYPEQAYFKGCGIKHNGEIVQVIIPEERSSMAALPSQLLALGAPEVIDGYLHFSDGELSFFVKEGENISPLPLAKHPKLLLEGGVELQATFLPSSLDTANHLDDLAFDATTVIQGISLAGQTRFKNLEIKEAAANTTIDHTLPTPPWLYRSSTNGDGTAMSQVPSTSDLGEGVVVPKTFRQNGVAIGDRGTIAYYGGGTTSPKEQQVEVFVAGFYDPGLIPVGNRLLFAGDKLVAMLRGQPQVNDKLLGNGVNIWVDDITQAEAVKESLTAALDQKGLSPYFTVESFADYEFAKPIVDQLRSDKTLFSLIALIILIVACSNVISMLILLVNDKKKEIGIMQSMGASPKRIAVIFGLCGFLTGLVSCIIGTTAALFTLRHLQSLVDFLSFMQGRDAFQSAFYGNMLPNTISYSVLGTVLLATTIISLLAGIIPAIKAARIRPAQILRSE